jgi:hypothetical protein
MSPQADQAGGRRPDGPFAVIEMSPRVKQLSIPPIINTYRLEGL